MKVALIGATGFVGKAILKELLSRRHHVIGIARNPDNSKQSPHLVWKNLDIDDTIALSKALQGNEAVISAYNAGWTNPNLYDDFLKGSNSIETAVRQSGIARYIVIGGAGSLYINGLQLVDSPEFPEQFKAGATAARGYLAILKKNKDIDWTYVSPSIEMNQHTSGIRTGKYRTGLESPIFDINGKSVLSVEDLAVAVVDELENPKHIQERFTAGYNKN